MSQSYGELMKLAKNAALESNLEKALRYLRLAQEIDNTDRVQRRIKKIEHALYNEESDCSEVESKENIPPARSPGRNNNSCASGFTVSIVFDLFYYKFDIVIYILQKLDYGFSMDNDVYCKLYPHQREGVQWMWSYVHKGGPEGHIKGGLLSDDMGLGKTIQVCAFISALIDMEEAKNFLIIVPTSLIMNWENELRKWVPNVDIFKYTGELPKNRRQGQLASAQRSTAVLIASYGYIFIIFTST